MSCQIIYVCLFEMSCGVQNSRTKTFICEVYLIMYAFGF